MYEKTDLICIIVAVLALLSLAAGPAFAGTVTQSFTYQGLLTDAAGKPLTGTYEVRFSLYTAPAGGTAIESTVQTVTCTDGRFTAPVAFRQDHFVGDALWMGVKVRSDVEMTPRVEIRPVPFALGLRPGVYTAGELPDAPIIKLFNLADGGSGVMGGATGDNSRGVYGIGLGSKSYGVYGESIHNAGVYGTGREGGYFTTHEGGSDWWDDRRPGVNVSTRYSYNPGITIATEGDDSHGVYSRTKGDLSTGLWAWTSGDESTGVFARTEGPFSTGVQVVTKKEYSDGVLARVEGEQSRGVYGESANAAGISGKGAWGGYFETNQDGSGDGSEDFVPKGIEVYAPYDNNRGISVSTSGWGSPGIDIRTQEPISPGIRVTTDESPGIEVNTIGPGIAGIGVRTSDTTSPGISVSTIGGNSDGVISLVNGAGSSGVKGESDRYMGVRGKGVWGGYFETNGAGEGNYIPNGIGVYAPYEKNRGIIAATYGANSPGVVAETANRNSPALTGSAAGEQSNGVVATSTQWTAIYADTLREDHGYGLYTPDDIYARRVVSPSVDVAEYMPVSNDVAPGTVLVIGKGGVLAPSATANDTHVAGIVSTLPGVALGKDENGNSGEALVAVAGRVPCLADASNGPIEEGDLLTTSSRPGYAMKATNPAVGTVLGKAMGTLESGTGTIEVLVTLQ